MALELNSSSSDTDHEFDTDSYPQMNDDLSMPGVNKELIDVVVTGFGPFDNHKVNASWETVKELKKLGVAHNVNLITMELPVEYDYVKQTIPLLWEKHKPHIVVHVGVSSIASDITIETCAHNEGYTRLDVTGKCASAQCYKKNGADCLQTSLDTKKICDEVNDSGCLAMAVLSGNAGRFLCEFTYYASLHEDSSRVVFVHIPCLDNPYTAVELANGLRFIILAIMKQLNYYSPLPSVGHELLMEWEDRSSKSLELFEQS